MHKILFRGKRLDNGEWVFGDLRHYRSGKVGIHSDALRYTLIVDPETVGQYTGINKNKIGQKIFEGDILQCWLGSDLKNGVVEYDERIAAFNVVFGDRCFTFLDFFLTKNPSLWYKVIGNIHDNPEQMKEGGE